MGYKAIERDWGGAEEDTKRVFRCRERGVTKALCTRK